MARRHKIYTCSSQFSTQFYSNHHPKTYALLTKKGLRHRVRRKMNGSESEDNRLKEKSSNKRTENIYHRAQQTDGFIQRDFGYVWLLKQILSESERVIRFKSSMTLISFTYSYEVFLLNNLRLKPILNWWRHMKSEKDIPFNNLLKISVVKRQLEYSINVK